MNVRDLASESWIRSLDPKQWRTEHTNIQDMPWLVRFATLKQCRLTKTKQKTYGMKGAEWSRGRRTAKRVTNTQDQACGTAKFFDSSGSGSRNAFRLRPQLHIKRPEGSGSGQNVPALAAPAPAPAPHILNTDLLKSLNSVHCRKKSSPLDKQWFYVLAYLYFHKINNTDDT